MDEAGIKSIMAGKALPVSLDRSFVATWGKLKSE
jgi:hypothetical protein